MSSSSLHYSTYNESVFRASVQGALDRVQSILDTTRHPRLAAEDDAHKYDDKYSLAEFLTNSANAALLNVLQQKEGGFGLNDEKLATVVKWVKDDKKTVTLRFQATDGCSLVKEQQVKITSPHTFESETTTTSTTAHEGSGDGGGGGGSLRNLLGGASINKNVTKTEKTTTRVTRTVTEYHWKVEVSYKISIFAGDAAASNEDDEKQRIELESRHMVATIVTAGGGSSYGGQLCDPCDRRLPTPPIPDKTVHYPIDVNLTWLFSTLDKDDNNNVYYAPRFTIERNDVKTCKTPRRNVQVQNAVDMYGELSQWASQVRHFMVHRLAKTIDASHQPTSSGDGSTSGGGDAIIKVGTCCKLQNMDSIAPTFNGKLVQVVEVLASGDEFVVEPVKGGVGAAQGLPPSLTCSRNNLLVVDKPIGSGGQTTMPLWELHTMARSIFVPILPIMENGSILSGDDANKLLNAQMRSMQQTIDKNIHQMYPPKDNVEKIISTLEATLVVLSHHINDLATTYHYSVDYIEEMLRNQLIQAIGKEVHPKDFDQFMHFYYKKLFGARYTPKPFTYAIRQPNRYPDGILSVEDISTTMTTTSGSGGNGNKAEPVASLVRHVPAVQGDSSIFIPINAATSVEITGDRYIHGWMQHCFQSSAYNNNEYQLAARARQFCSFMIIVGNMAGPDIFQPKEAIILQNKDEVLIPLITKVLPSAKEFKDAIASLSPEQQAFAKAFRSMQLETSVFGVCVVQIKPQLEKLLGLPSGALTKEIQLTQDLMSLFVDYQIPSDLLSFDGGAAPGDGTTTTTTTTTTEMSMAAKLAAVKGHVKSVMDVLEAAKEKQLIEEERKADMRAEMKFQSSGGEGVAFASCGMEQLSFSTQSASVARSTGKPYVYRKKCTRGAPSAAMNFQPRMMAMCSAPLGAHDVMDTCSAFAADSCYNSLQNDMASFDVGGIDATQRQARNDVPQKQVGRMEKGDTTVEDYTMIPKLLDAKLEAFDTDNSLRPTIIEAGTTWTRKHQENLLTSAKTYSLAPSVIQDEKKKAFDLLDALSRSGTLPIECAELHVMVGVTHCFENDVMGTVIQDNINPIHKVEKSLLMLASTIFREPASALIHHDDDGQLQQRLTASFPQLFIEPGQQE